MHLVNIPLLYARPQPAANEVWRFPVGAVSASRARTDRWSRPGTVCPSPKARATASNSSTLTRTNFGSASRGGKIENWMATSARDPTTTPASGRRSERLATFITPIRRRWTSRSKRDLRSGPSRTPASTRIQPTRPPSPCRRSSGDGGRWCTFSCSSLRPKEQTHIFRPGEPFVQILILPEEADFDLVPMPRRGCGRTRAAIAAHFSKAAAPCPPKPNGGRRPTRSLTAPTVTFSARRAEKAKRRR